MAASPRPGDAGSLVRASVVAHSPAPVVGQEVGRRGGGGSGRPGSQDGGDVADPAGQEVETGWGAADPAKIGGDNGGRSGNREEEGGWGGSESGSGSVKKPGAQWNPAFGKGLVEILQEHNTPYHRGQNGWSTEAWNRMADLFHERYGHTNFTKQSKFDKSFLLYIQSWPEIAKFQNEPFPLYNKLGDLYDGHIAEGNFNFTSIEVTQVSDGDPEVEREQPAFSFNLNQYDDDVHMYNNPRDAAQSDEPRYATQSDGRRDAIQSDEPRDATQTGAPGGSNKKPVKESKKKTRDDPMVEVMAQYVEIKRKQAEEESVLLVGSKNAQEFSLNSAAEDEDSVVAFLRSKMAELHQHI
ncbi:uncharacterized protein LOC119350470 [Triticum dicoccoides]|uniref:uncharacterized protein LOC119350470 n=1 Tax=Triticum dicoccoides TaxID=85692 RepID=UPI0018904B8B|nr:uncharacterized protein LOC119350470 [Triticum dicoccoides]